MSTYRSTPRPTAPPRTPQPLTPEQIASFVDHGFLVLRRAFSPVVAAELVQQTLVDRAPRPRIGVRSQHAYQQLSADDLDLQDPRTWASTRLDLETGRSLRIEAFAPRVWDAVTSLVGPSHTVRRATMGEQWILNARFLPPPRPPLTPDYFTGLEWHYDAPSPRCTLDGRTDALILLILWSNTAEGGGGPLLSGQSLDHVVHLLEDHPEGVDTTDYDWSRPLVGRCTDVQEFHGRAGDVVIAHALSLHTGHPNYSTAVRILENPTITVAAPLDYHSDNPDPSPVERAVIQRLRRPRPRPRNEALDVARYLVAYHPDYFTPDRAGWTARVPPATRDAVHRLDRWVSCTWIANTVARIRQTNGGGLSAALACAAVVRQLLVNQRAVSAHLTESFQDDDFPRTALARMMRGLVSCEGQNYLLGRLLAEFFDVVYPFNTYEPDTQTSGHFLVEVVAPDGAFFADAWADEPVFALSSRHPAIPPGVPEYDELGLSEARMARGFHPRASYERGARSEPIERLAVPPRPPEVDTLLTHALPAYGPNAWQAYLRARARHLFEPHADPGAHYLRLIDEHRFGRTTHEVLTVLLQRFNPGRKPGVRRDSGVRRDTGPRR